MTVSIKKLAKTVGKKLHAKKLRLVTAESCTGGGLSYWITQIAGSSKWFENGFVTYSNASKEKVLGVSTFTLHTFGAVSEQTAREMAEGALKRSDADISIAITGIAGPAGGTVAKPIGTVWFALACKGKESEAFVNIFTGDREEIRKKAILLALQTLLEFLN